MKYNIFYILYTLCSILCNLRELALANRRKLRKPGALIPRFLKVGGGVISFTSVHLASPCVTVFQNRCFLLAQRCRTNATFGEVTINLRCEKVAKNPPSEEPIFHEKSAPFSRFVDWENDGSRNTSSIWRPLLRIQTGVTFTFGQFLLADICSIFAFFDEFGSGGPLGSRGGI